MVGESSATRVTHTSRRRTNSTQICRVAVQEGAQEPLAVKQQCLPLSRLAACCLQTHAVCRVYSDHGCSQNDGKKNDCLTSLLKQQQFKLLPVSTSNYRFCCFNLSILACHFSHLFQSTAKDEGTSDISLGGVLFNLKWD